MGEVLDISTVMSAMTLEEKIRIVAGAEFMYTFGVPRLGVPPLCMADGPHGLRKQTGSMDNGVSKSEPATAFPTAVTVASSWNPDNARRIGAAIGEECRAYNVHMLLGPGVNIKRNPLCGRNFEYFSEDPLLAGEMGAAEVSGVQSTGVGACVKHFALNNTENYRFMGNSVADERTMREIYLRPFERVVRQSQPAAVMSAYNKINGAYCSNNQWLLADVLREDWAFEGLVMTDWGGMHDRVASLHAGLDLEMPGDTVICRMWIADGLADGSLSLEELDAAVENVLEMVNGLVPEEEPGAYGEFDREAHDKLAAEVAADSAVLLKNESALPLSREGRFVVLGDLFEKMRYQGAGSSMINPTSVVTPKDAFDVRGISYEFARGYGESATAEQPDFVQEACDLVKSRQHDAILVFAGLTDYVESEGADRETMALPANQLALIDAVAALGKPVVVVLFGGSAIEVPFADDVDGLLYMALPGQMGGKACADLLFGDACPSGHLAETWPLKYEDVPGSAMFGKGKVELYKEGMFVGYRGFGTKGKQVRYPFGFGLSYTSFAWSDLQVRRDVEQNDVLRVSAVAENTGSRAGATTLQLYVAAPLTMVEKPSHELRAFRKVYLKPGQRGVVEWMIPISELAFYHERQSRWVVEAGEYDFRLCTDAENVVLSASHEIEGASISGRIAAEFEYLSDASFATRCGCPDALNPECGEVTVESRFPEVKRSLVGRMLFGAIFGVLSVQQKRAERMPEGVERDNRLKGALFLRRVMESNSLISMSMCAGKAFPYNFAQAFAEIANGHLGRGIKRLCSPIRVRIPDVGAVRRKHSE